MCVPRAERWAQGIPLVRPRASGVHACAPAPQAIDAYQVEDYKLS